MRKIFLLFVFYYSLLIAHNSFSQSGWIMQQSNFQYYPHDFSFIDSQTGWICMDSGYVSKTTNGGANWTQYSTGTLLNLYSVKFVNNMTGWTAGGAYYSNPFSYEYSIILKTTDGGINWTTQVYSSYGPRFNNLAVINENFAFATASGIDFYGMGSTGNMLGTSNGGINWNLGISGLAFNYVTFNSGTGWACGYRKLDTPPTVRMIYKTSNSGFNWSILYKDTIQNFNPMLYKVQFVTQNAGYLLTDLLKKTTNEGVNWLNVDSVNTYGLSDMYFLNLDTGWICKNPIIRTNNGGVNWINQTIPQGVNKILFINSNTGWGLGTYNKVLIKTTTGGMTFIKKNSENISDHFSLSQNYPNPFNPSTIIRFQIKDYRLVTLKVYDILGKEIATLVNQKLKPGEYETQFPNEQMNNVRLPSGVYFYSLFADGNLIDTKKLVLLK